MIDVTAILEKDFNATANFKGVVNTCLAATYKNSDGSFTQSIAAGDTYTAPDITVTDSDGSQSTQPANTDVVCTLAQDATYQNSDGSFVVQIASGNTFTSNDVDVEVNGTSEGDLITNKQVSITLEDTDGATVTPDSVDVSNNVVDIVVPKPAASCADVKTYLQNLLDADSKFFVSEVDLEIPVDSQGVEGGVWAMDYDSVNNKLYVGTRAVNSPVTLRVYDWSDRTLESSINPLSETSDLIYGVKVNNAGTLVVVGFQGNRFVSAYDTATLTEQWRLNVGNRISSIWYSDDDAFVYVAHINTGNVQKIDTSTGLLDSTIVLSGGVTNGASKYQNLVYIPNRLSKTLLVFDCDTDTELTPIVPASNAAQMDAVTNETGGNLMGVYVDADSVLVTTNRGGVIEFTDTTFATQSHYELAANGTLDSVGLQIFKINTDDCFTKFLTQQTGNSNGESRGVRELYKFRD